MNKQPPQSPEKSKHSILRRVLEDTTVLLTTAGLITLFCQVIDVNAQKTAAYSLSATLLATCCLYKKWINKSIPSALVVGLLLGLATVFFFNYQDILLK